jgi:hypothetical protein
MNTMDKQKMELRVATNRGGARVFQSLYEVCEFSRATSGDLATLTAVVEDSDLDTSYVIQTLGLLNDLAFQLQQSVALVCDSIETPGTS